MSDVAPILDPTQQEEFARQVAARRANIAVPSLAQGSPLLRGVSAAADSAPAAAPQPATPTPVPPVGGTRPVPAPVSAEDRMVSRAQGELQHDQDTQAATSKLMNAAKDIGSNPDSFMGRHPGIARIVRPFAEVGAGVVRGIETTGNIAAPGVMMNIPGTQFNRAARITGDESRVAQAEENRNKAAAAQNLEAEAEKNRVLAANGGNPGTKTEDLAYDKNGAVIGWHDAKGVLHAPDDPATPANIKAVLAQANDKTIDEPKQPLGDAGVNQHAAQLNTLTFGMDANQKSQFLAAYGAQPTDTHAVATKRLEDAKAAAAMQGAERDRKIAQDTAQKNHSDQQANIHTQQTNSIYERVRQPYVAQLGKLHDALQANEMAAADLTAGSPVGQAVGIIKSLSAMAGGMGSGVRITKAELDSIANARTGGHWAALAQQMSTGKALTQDQVGQLQSLIADVRDLAAMKERVLNAGLDKMNYATTPQEVKDSDTLLRKQFAAIENHKAFTPSQLAHYAQTKGQTTDQVKQGMEKAGWVEVPE